MKGQRKNEPWIFYCIRPYNNIKTVETVLLLFCYRQRAAMCVGCFISSLWETSLHVMFTFQYDIIIPIIIYCPIIMVSLIQL